MLKNQFGMLHLSTGDLLRDAAKNGTGLGKLAVTYMNKGELVPNKVMLGIIDSYLRVHADDSILFDGFPRTEEQAAQLEKMLNGYPVKVLALTVPDESVINRLSSRRVCEGCGKLYNVTLGGIPEDGCTDCGGKIYQRKDDMPETIANRLSVYHQQTEPVMEFYENRNMLLEVDGEGSLQAVSDRIMEALA